MIVWNRHIWLSAGRDQTGRNVLVPVSVPEMTVRLRGVLHAASPTIHYGKPRRKTIDTICGKRAYPVALRVDEDHAIVPIWPPPTRFGLGERCPECRDAAERKRPDPMYREVELRGVA